MNMKQIKSWLLVKAAMIAALFGVAANVNAEDKFYLPDFSIEAGETKELAIQFESDKVCASDPSQLEYVAFQFDIYLPEGLTIVQKKGKYNFTFNTERNDDHTFSPALQADGAIRVAAASLTNAYFWETSGDFVYFSVTAAADFSGDHEITMKTINFSDIEGNMATLPDVTTKVTGPAAGVAVTGITLDKATAELTEGESLTLVATVAPDNATDKTVVWSSSDETVATVKDGVVTTLKAGEATITAKAGEQTATCVVTVKAKVIAVTGITLDKATAELTEGESLTLVATVAPDNATDKTVVWTSSDETVATVKDGVVTTLKAGEATITAKAGEQTATCVVTVKAKVIAVTGITLDKATAEVTEGESLTLVATVAPDNATDKTVVWSSSDETVATVKDGVVTTLKAGEATITAKAGEQTATCVVTVKAKVIAVTGITLDKATAELTEGESLTLVATVAPDNATDKTVVWSSSDETVATVKDGVVTTLRAGEATITAKAGEQTATCVVTVKEKAKPTEPVVKMTYVDYNQPSTAMGEIAAGATARAGYNKISGGSVAFANTGWGENKITYIQVDASCYTGDIVSAKLTVEVSGSTDSKRTTGWGVGYNSSVWSAGMTYETADKTITTIGEQLWTSTKSATTFETKEFDILDAFKNDADKVVTLLVYETAAAGGYIKNPQVAIEAANPEDITSYTVKYVDEAGTEIAEPFIANIMIGQKAALTAEDKADKYNADNTKKYIYASCDRDSIVTVADSASNVITATFREALKYNYTVETTDDSGSLMITMGSYSGFEGENVKAPYYAYVLNEADSTLYESAKNNKEYNKYVDLTQDNMKVQVNYTPTTIKNVVYYQEAENVEGLTKVTTGNTAIRSSNSASAYAAEADVVLTDLAPGKYKMTAVIYDATKNFGSEFSFIAGADTVLKAVSTAANWTSCTSGEFTLTANAALSLAKGGSTSKAVDFFYIQKTGEAPARFDLTAYNDTVAWANEVKATLNAEDATEAELIVTIDDFIASAAQWLEETLADPEATQADVDLIASDLKLQINAVMERLPILKLWPEAEALRMEADSVYASYTEPTDEAGLVNALRSFPRSPMFIMSVEELQTAIETLKTALAAFIVENEVVGGAKIAYLCGATETTEAIYTALVEAGYDVTPLNYDAVTLTEEIVANDFVGKYDVVVLAGATGSSTTLAATHNLLIGKVNVLSTKAFWYKKTSPAGTNGSNPGAADAPSTGLVKVAGYEEHPIYAGIEGAEFAVFNESEAVTNGRYLQGNGALSGIEQATVGTTNGANCIGEAWVDGKGWMIIPVDGDNSANFSLTADGAQLFVNAVDYLIAGEQFEYNLVEGVRVEAAQWPADIYDLSGRMIKKAATSLEGLDKGLYFIQGKKVLVK